eukprot:TRINITY_DN25539_c0_g1_i1.p1 TRINITY_DN25539_c0_g1~~TRINITY_DN25539_c0_g1_i1.p1  ORF type:complete len:438 (-),score=99.36 TRINITY_DN25539_c0_g1_i1:280-1482(-)
MDPAKDGVAFHAAPPPVGGLGNFKGVMLCNRPSDDPSQGRGEGANQPFRSMIASTHGEQLGLTPCRNYEPSVKTRGPSAALRRHVKWLKELQGQMQEERDQVEAEEQDTAARERRMKEVFHKHREGVRQMMEERNAAEAAELQAQREARKAQREGSMYNTSKKKGPQKPQWAMTDKERDDVEEGEADELINFAESLDYDKFIHDVEFRDGVAAMKDRAGKLKKEQEAFKDALIRDYSAQLEDEEGSTSAGGSPRSSKHLEDGLEGHSVLGDLRSEYSVGSRRSRGADRYDAEGRVNWDSSTNAGDDRPQVDNDMKDAADAILESNTMMRQIHSKDSVLKMLEKQRERAKQDAMAGDLTEMMRREGPAPVPVITTSSDTQNRLHKPTDPSLLPYLYRSPAI